MKDEPRFYPPVRYYPPVGLSLLFTPLPKGGKRPVLEVSHAISPEHTLHFSAREALGVPEQTLLLAVLGLAGEQYRVQGNDAVVSAKDGRTLPGRLWSGLYPDGGSETPSTLMLSTTWEELNRRCGSQTSGGSIIEMRKRCLRRLCEVIVWEESLGKRTSRQSFLLVWLEGTDRHIHLALNHRLASAYLGGQYSKVWMSERQRLSSDLAMHVHAFLSTCIKPEASLTIGLRRLAERVWPANHDTAPPGTRRRRLAELRAALDAIGRLSHWTVLWQPGRDVAHIQRKQTMPAGTTGVVRDMTEHCRANIPEEPPQSKRTSAARATTLAPSSTATPEDRACNVSQLFA